MHRLSQLLPGLLFLCIFIVDTTAAEDHPIPDEYVYCTVCHGTLFKGNIATRAPKLTGLSAWYIESQLLAFRNGKRGNHVKDLAGLEMRPMAEMLSRNSVSRVSKLISALPSGLSIDTAATSNDRGQYLYNSCGACHGADGRGSQQLNAPNLVVQDSWYLTTQLNSYRHNIRGINDNDITGLQMLNASSILTSDQDVMDTVAYIKSLQN